MNNNTDNTHPSKTNVDHDGVGDTTETTEATAPISAEHIQLRLMLGDKASIEDQRLGDEVVAIISQRLQDTLALGEGMALMVRIDQCTQGNSCTRTWGSGLGLGWVVLEAKFSLWMDHTPLIVTQTKKLTDSGAMGCADLCDAKFGRKALLHKLAPNMADIISHTVRQKLG